MIRRGSAVLWRSTSDTAIRNQKCRRVEFPSEQVEPAIIRQRNGYKRTLFTQEVPIQVSTRTAVALQAIVDKDYRRFNNAIQSLKREDWRNLSKKAVDDFVEMTMFNCDPIAGYQQLREIQTKVKGIKQAFTISPSQRSTMLLTIMRAVAWAQKHNLEVKWCPKDIYRMTRDLPRPRTLSRNQYFQLCSFMISSGLHGEARTVLQWSTEQHGADQAEHEILIRQLLQHHVSYVALKLLLDLLKEQIKPSVSLAMTVFKVVHETAWAQETIMESIEAEDLDRDLLAYISNTLTLMQIQRGQPVDYNIATFSVGELEGLIIALTTAALNSPRITREEWLAKNDEVLTAYSAIWERGQPASKYVHHLLIEYFYRTNLYRRDVGLRRQFGRFMAFLLECNRPIHTLLNRDDLLPLLKTAAHAQNHAVFKALYSQILVEYRGHQWKQNDLPIIIKVSDNALEAGDADFVRFLYHDWIANGHDVSQELSDNLLKIEPDPAMIEQINNLVHAQGQVPSLSLQEAYTKLLDGMFEQLQLGTTSESLSNISFAKAEQLLTRISDSAETNLRTIHAMLQRILAVANDPDNESMRLYTAAVNILASRNDPKGCMELCEHAFARGLIIPTELLDRVILTHLPNATNALRAVKAITARQRHLPSIHSMYKVYQEASEQDKRRLEALVKQHGSKEQIRHAQTLGMTL